MQPFSWAAIAAGLALLLAFALFDHFGEREHIGTPQPPTSQSQPAAQLSDDSPRASKQPSDASSDRGLVIHDVRVLDENQRVVYRGDVDLAPTLQRIERGEWLQFSHDGIVFENRERRLPTGPRGYYHEFVQPTPGDDGPGAQRVVIGRQGDVYYTPDHYRTFRKVRSPRSTEK